MTPATEFSPQLWAALRQARCRRWLVAAVLACTVGIYSIVLTHHHKTKASELACPVCQVMAHGAPSLHKPKLTPVVSIAGWYRHDLPQSQHFVISLQFDYRPQPRAPPLLASSLV